MSKKCIICSQDAIYQIKDTSDYYCLECAQDNFSDLELLEKVEESAKKLKEFIDDDRKIDE